MPLASTVLLIIILVVVLWGVVIYNRLITLKNRIENAWAQIDVQLRRRYDLIPNLINAVKGYMKHEKDTLTELTKARTNLIKGDENKRAQASNQVSDALKTIFAVAENYPDLKASQNFMHLQEELSGTENKIAYARQSYNDNVLAWNEKIQQFPAVFMARLLSYKEKVYFQVEEAAKKPVKVSF